MEFSTQSGKNSVPGLFEEFRNILNLIGSLFDLPNFLETGNLFDLFLDIRDYISLLILLFLICLPLVPDLSQLLDHLPQTFPDLGEPFCSEKEKEDHQNDYNFRQTETEHCFTPLVISSRFRVRS